MITLELDQHEESALAFLVQSCVSNGLLLRSGLTADQAAFLLEPVKRISGKLLALPPLSSRSGSTASPS